MFSATFNILPGSTINPSMATIIAQGGSYTDTQVSRWNNLGYIPVVSTITGLARALLGVIHSIVHLVMALFDGHNRAYHMEQVALGGRNIVRGSIEMVPIVGNLALFIRDLVVATKVPSAVRDYARKNPNEVHNRTVLFVDNENVASKSWDEMKQILINENVTSEPPFWDLVRMIRA